MPKIETLISPTGFSFTLAPGPQGTSFFWIGSYGNAATSAISANELHLAPLFLGRSYNFDMIGGEVTAGVVGSTVIPAIYSDIGGYPGSLLLSGPALNGNVVAVQTFPITLQLAPGLYWIGGVSQGGAPTIRSVGGNGFPWFGAAMSYGNALVFGAPGSFVQNPVAGALPATFPQPAAGGTAPFAHRIALRVAS